MQISMHAFIIAKPHLATGDVFLVMTNMCKRTTSKNSKRNEIPFLTLKNNKGQHYKVPVSCIQGLKTSCQLQKLHSASSNAQGCWEDLLVNDSTSVWTLSP